MIPRKRRKIIIIISIILVILMIITSLILLYINTDMFRSKSTLFAKYMGQNVDHVASFYKEIGKNQYKELLEQNKYTTQSQFKINYAENIGTSSENTKNSINQFKLKINGQTDKSNQYNYQDIQILNNDETISQIEYIQSENTYGIRFSDIFNQYISLQNENLKEFLLKIGFTNEQLANIPDKIEFDNELDNNFELSEQEIQNIKNKYIDNISNNISKNNFSKQKNQHIQINGKNIIANGYTLTMTKEQLNNIYIEILEEVKQDEIILSRMDKIQTMLEKYNLTTEEVSLRKKFEEDIENYIEDITRNNIGNDETKITVYENKGTTVSTMIQTSDYEVYIDLLPYETEKYMQISYKDITSKKEQEQVLTYQKTNQQTSVVLNNTIDGKKTEYSLVIDEKAEGNQYTKNTVAKYQNDKSRLELISDKQINLVNNFEQQVVLNEENSINLSKMETEQVIETLEKAQKGILEKANEIATTNINSQDFVEILKTTGLVSDEQILNAIGVTQTERNRFNSQFEILQGENLEDKDVLRIIDAIKLNLNDMEVTSNTELKLKLDRFNHNEELVTTISTFIEGQISKKYNVTVEYDDTTGLVEYIVLTMLER